MERPGEPPSGLGNFKGVMLCTRPDESGRPADAGPAPFRSAVAPTYGEQLGLPPPAKTTTEEVGGPKPQRTLALNRHLAWLKQLQNDMQQARADAAAEKAANDMRHQKTHQFCEQARERVRAMRAEAEAAAKEEREKAAAAKSAAPAAAKPKWAMTEKEHEEFDEEETVELLDFVDALNFDEYIQDLEFREALEGLKSQVHKLDKAQDVFKRKLAEQFNAADEDDAQSATNVGGDPFADRAKADAGNGKPEWDGSVLSEAAPSVLSEHKDLADRVLKENSDIRSVHSAASVARIIEKAQREKASEAEA